MEKIVYTKEICARSEDDAIAIGLAEDYWGPDSEWRYLLIDSDTEAREIIEGVTHA